MAIDPHFSLCRAVELHGLIDAVAIVKKETGPIYW